MTRIRLVPAAGAAEHLAWRSTLQDRLRQVAKCTATFTGSSELYVRNRVLSDGAEAKPGTSWPSDAG